MALILQNYALNNLILQPREGMRAKFAFDDPWTEIRCGIYYSILPMEQNGGGIGEILFNNGTAAFNAASDYATVGLVPSTQLVLPGEAGSLFVGAGTFAYFGSTYPPAWYEYATTSFYFPNGDPVHFPPDIESSYNTVVGSGILKWPMIATAWKGTAFNLVAPQIAMPVPDNAQSQAYAAFFCQRFQIVNRGGPSQAIKLSASAKLTAGYTNYNQRKLQQDMNGATFVNETSIPWHDSGVPRAIPDAYWARLPFKENRLRIAQMRITKYS